MNILSLASALVIALSPLVASANEVTPGARYSMSEAELARFDMVVARGLRDPGSAMLRDVIAVKGDDGQISVCGLVNAKNGYGGYSGDLPFMAFLKRNGDLFSIGDDEIMYGAIETICSSVRKVYFGSSPAQGN
ncbi:hypothetical protein ACGYK8_18560 [Sulfitobacter sp. 1A09149]|uniref:hypothetical protein n=1 Tax=Sulfitobacter sp. 1A09149 TaxID=3368584 RepID=UPI003745FEA0